MTFPSAFWSTPTIDDLYRDMPANPAGLSLGVVASDFVLDCYYERGALEPLVKAYSGGPVPARVYARSPAPTSAGGAARRSDRALVDLGRPADPRGVLLSTSGRDYGDHERVEEHKNYALEAYSQGIDWMSRLGRLDAAERLTAERDALREERIPSLPIPSGLRRIDEPVFWDLISKARSQAPTTLEQLAVLGESLRAFKAAEIKRLARAMPGI